MNGGPKKTLKTFFLFACHQACTSLAARNSSIWCVFQESIFNVSITLPFLSFSAKRGFEPHLFFTCSALKLAALFLTKLEMLRKRGDSKYSKSTTRSTLKNLTSAACESCEQHALQSPVIFPPSSSVVSSAFSRTSHLSQNKSSFTKPLSRHQAVPPSGVASSTTFSAAPSAGATSTPRAHRAHFITIQTRTHLLAFMIRLSPS